jgi:LacI family transcriptional regulator
VGFSGALSSQGIRESAITIRHCELTAPDARRAVRDIVASTRPDALLVCNPKLMLGALQGLEAEDVTIPQDMLVAGYADDSLAISWRPTITSVAQHPREVGRSAMQLLLDRIERPTRSIQRVVIQPTLTIRESSAGIGRVALAATS